MANQVYTNYFVHFTLLYSLYDLDWLLLSSLLCSVEITLQQDQFTAHVNAKIRIPIS